MENNKFAKGLNKDLIIKVDMTSTKDPQVIFSGPWDGLKFGGALRLIKQSWKKRKYNFLITAIKKRQDETNAQKLGQTKGVGDAK